MASRFWSLLGRSVAKGHARSRGAVDAARALEVRHRDLDADGLRAAADGLRGAGSLDVPAFLALAREASDQALSLRPFDTQLYGAVRLLEGDVIEMATGEGKTLSGAVAAAAYVLQGRDVHVVSVNDFLARRDAEWMGPFYDALGVTVGWITAESTADERRAAYGCDVTYASVNEVGFDVLRDHLVDDVDTLVSPTADVAVVDEADSVLVDEALVPLVLAGSIDQDVSADDVLDAVRSLDADTDWEVDTDRRNVFLTDAGAEKLEDALGGIDLYSEEHVGTTLVRVNLTLHAEVLVRRDVDYIVRDGRVQLVNASRGRVAELQRWPDGLQAAVEAKEGLARTETGQVLDTITVQALMGRYRRVCGMTGTALAAGEQLRTFYGLGVSVVEPNEPLVRVDEVDRVYATAPEKNAAVVAAVLEAHATGQPVLVGTHDVEESESLAARLEDAGVPVVALNAKNDAEEAEIIARAGLRDAVTVSTQIAGRGTDIRLGDGVTDLGGLLVIGTARYVTERLDNQLRGRAGRQGDPGRSVFFASWDDSLVTRYLEKSDRPGHPDDTGFLESEVAAKRIDHAQRVAEGAMLDTHASTWRYNQLTAQHRDILDTRRAALLGTDEAWDLLATRNPERAAELEAVDSDARVRAARRIVLHHLDRAWSDYLAHLGDVRESIHLRALGRQNPLDEYHRIAIEAFAEVQSRALEESDRTFLTSTITDDGVDLESAGLVRPSSTWTYVRESHRPLAF
ncbi:accessory Sec system translocase SecA2 [Rhodococcus sp. BP-241]|uniref:accessory Sec system translocase SecA2 n=1 Tax=Rhodococcus sp. BP-241 TaxID=2739441 RepID=UPI001C9A450A|nr:accessory Sec system translocase SecA2 [Rhodococcus sp. BP-241]MBY6707250.1 accessory Sec system translocase SecA2 [Rhodococcus sp. BP-241]